MMRWGVSIGIGVEPFDPEELAGLPADDVETATEILHQIKRTFEAARETSESSQETTDRHPLPYIERNNILSYPLKQKRERKPDYHQGRNAARLRP